MIESHETTQRLRVVALFRVSTELQASHGASLDAQARRFEELAISNGWIVVARLRGCESATKAAADREVLQGALSAIRQHDADAIYVHEQSRLTRGDELEVAVLMRELRERGCKIIVGGSIRSLNSIDERFALRIQAVVDRAEAERIVERTGRGRREKAKQGKWNCGNAPYGYFNPPKGDSRRGTLQVNPEEAAEVRKIFGAIAGGESCRSVADRLKVPRSTILRMIRNPTYTGAMAFFRWKRKGRSISPKPAEFVVERAHEAIVDPIAWAKVQAILVSVPRRGISTSMLTGILHVNEKPMIAESGHGVQSYSARGGGCWIERRMVDNAVWDGFRRMIDSPQVIADIRAAVTEGPNAQLVAQDEELTRTRLAKLQKRLDGLSRMRADGEIGKSEFTRLTSETQAKIDECKRELQALTAQRPDPGTDLEATADTLRRVMAAGLPDGDRRRLLQSLVTSVHIDAKRKAACRPWRIENVRFRVGGMHTTCSSYAHNPAAGIEITVVQGGSAVLFIRRVPVETAQTKRVGRAG